MAFKLVCLQLLLGILFGGSAQLYIAGFLLVSESIDSPRLTTRWWYRYCIVSFWLSIALPLLLAGFGALGETLKPLDSVRAHPSILLFTSLLVALGLYFLDRRIKLYFDPRKAAARKALLVKGRCRTER